MRIRTGTVLGIPILILSCLLSTGAGAQIQYAQYGPPPPGYSPERREEEHERREHERREWRREDWRRHNERYFGGGVVIEQEPSENYEHYAARIRAQCNVQWGHCATYCNAIPDSFQRAGCVGNCNNELYECKSGY